jgi:hypothetical protein
MRVVLVGVDIGSWQLARLAVRLAVAAVLGYVPLQFAFLVLLSLGRSGEGLLGKLILLFRGQLSW